MVTVRSGLSSAPRSILVVPSDVSMNAAISPSVIGESVIERFIRTMCAGAGPCPSYSSRMAFAAATHSSVRNWYFAMPRPCERNETNDVSIDE